MTAAPDPCRLKEPMRRRLIDQSAENLGRPPRGLAPAELHEFTGSGVGRALVLDAEQGAKSLKRRLREAELDKRDDVDVIRVPDGLAITES